METEFETLPDTLSYEIVSRDLKVIEMNWNHPVVPKDIQFRMQHPDTLEMFQTGKLQYYEDLKRSEYAPLTEFLRIPGMGPKHARLGLPGREKKALDMGGELFHWAGW